MPYTPTRSSNNGEPMWQGHSAGYYQPFPTPDGKDSYPIRSFDGKSEGHLLTSTALRHDALPMGRTSSTEPAQKRKRASSGAKDSAGNSTSKALKTPKRPKQSSPDDHTAKRPRTDNTSVTSTAPSQLPTPPTLGKEISAYSLPHHVPLPPRDLSPPASTDSGSESARRRPGVVIARHEQEGRKINIFGVQHGENEEIQPDQAHFAPRHVGIPTLQVDTSGRAKVEPSLVLEHDAAWLEGKRSANDTQLGQPRTPAVNDNMALPAEVDDTPRTKEGKVSKRLQAFASDVKPNESMVSTRIVKVGRVALRKDAAIKFLGLDETVGTCEETKSEEDEHWIESAVASSSKVVLTPNWPDNESPWRLAGGLAKHRKLREADEKAAVLRRYLESATDESSDEEREDVQPHILQEDDKRTVSTYISRAQAAARRHRGRRVVLHADAKAALLGGLRSRLVTYFSPGGPVTCQCNVTSRADKGKMISCDGCGTWHHLECQGITDEYSLQGHWLCHACGRQANPLERNIRPIAMLDPYQERAAAFKDWSSNVALAPSPLFPAVPNLATRTPGRKEFLGASPRRPQRSRIMSYGSDYFNFPEDSPANPMPSTPAPIRPNRFSTPRNEDSAFDVHSTPSRHIDFNLGGPSLFSLTPLAARGRVTSGLGGNLLETPMRKSLAHGLAASEPSEFFKELNKGTGIDGVGSMTVGASPQTRWPHNLMGAHNLSPSPFGHRRSLSGNGGRMSSIRSSSRSGLGVGFADLHDDDE